MRQGQDVLDKLGVVVPPYGDQSNEAVIWRVLAEIAHRLEVLESDVREARYSSK